MGAIGLPPEVIAVGVAVVYGIDPIMDMMRTATNVAGQIVVPTLVARQEGLLDDAVTRGERPAPDVAAADTPAPRADAELSAARS
jgi:Na+/H+-dicarboxylate symporter